MKVKRDCEKECKEIVKKASFRSMTELCRVVHAYKPRTWAKLR